jgi:hypothetical protein
MDFNIINETLILMFFIICNYHCWKILLKISRHFKNFYHKLLKIANITYLYYIYIYLLKINIL